mmetsp:Transcript_29297/g.72338  ORF Transcript_29297/g.72338 Transcript_29297/m.72338 type:complete len:266 (+) Transcript_29297:3185-3982(+)
MRGLAFGGCNGDRQVSDLGQEHARPAGDGRHTHVQLSQDKPQPAVDGQGQDGGSWCQPLARRHGPKQGVFLWTRRLWTAWARPQAELSQTGRSPDARRQERLRGCGRGSALAGAVCLWGGVGLGRLTIWAAGARWYHGHYDPHAAARAPQHPPKREAHCVRLHLLDGPHLHWRGLLMGAGRERRARPRPQGPRLRPHADQRLYQDRAHRRWPQARGCRSIHTKVIARSVQQCLRRVETCQRAAEHHGGRAVGGERVTRGQRHEHP